jgi:hypothetical protein
MKILSCILSYNMPQITNHLYEQLIRLTNSKEKIIVFDNGSDKNKVSEYTTFLADTNTKLTGGMNFILSIIKKHFYDSFDAYWLMTNDINFEYDKDPVKNMSSVLETNSDIGIIHPSLIRPVYNYAYPWMIKIPGNENLNKVTKNHTMVDIICPIYTKKALNVINWEFDKRFIYGWGIDYDSCYQIRKSGLKVAVNFDLLVSHQTSVVYDSGNDKEFKNRQEYYKKAGENMNKVMNEKYGENWIDIINKKFDWEYVK